MSESIFQRVINLDQYPIDQFGHIKRGQLVDQVKADLAKEGCALIKNFLSDVGLSLLIDEAQDRRENAYFSAENQVNAYFSPADNNLPKTHPVNWFMPRTNGFITSDLLGEETAARQIYNWPVLGKFLADCLGKDELHLYADPISNMIVNVGKPGSQFNWHFDTNEFTITILLRGAQSGGYFEYVPDIRSVDDERYEDVGQVLRGERTDNVRRLDLQAGDLQFFLGRYALHQVTENTGSTDRLLLIMSFTEKPDVIGSAHRVKQLYGKLAPQHQQQRVRSDSLKD